MVPQFADYAVAQREWLASEESRTQLDYWRDRLAGLPEVLDLSLGRARPAVRTTAGDWVMFELPAPLSTHVAELCGQERITVFMYLMAVCQLVLARWSSRTDIVVGTPVANRRSVADQRLVGYLANTVVMRTDLGGRPTRRELLRRVRDVALGAYAHQELPFDRVVAELRPTRRLDSSPLFQVMLVFQDNAAREVPWPGLRVEPISVATPVCMFDLSLVMRADGQGIHGALNYRTDMFSRSDVERLTADFQHVAAQVVSEPDQPIGPLSPPHGGTPRDPETTTPGGEHT
jgi:non-ribosomal peptide synthetase component F